MLQSGSLALALAAAVVCLGLLFWLANRFRGPSAAERDSLESHRAAQSRDPPVDIGDVRDAGVREFTDHHSGERHAVCKVEGFVVFVENVPADLEETEAIRFRVLSFNRGHTSATATFLERA